MMRLKTDKSEDFRQICGFRNEIHEICGFTQGFTWKSMDLSTKMWISDEKDLRYYLDVITENNTSANIHIPLTMNCV